MRIILVAAFALLSASVSAEEPTEKPSTGWTSPYLSFETLKKYYDYDPSLPLEAKLSHEQKVEGGAAYQLTFRGHDGISVYGDIVVPDGDGPFPVLIAPSYMTRGTDLRPGWFGPTHRLAPHGVLTAWLDYRIDRRAVQGNLVDDDRLGQPGLVVWARINTVADFRRLLDYLLGTYNVDQSRVCYGGASKGGMMGTILGAVDPRVKQFVIRAAGADVVMWMEDSQDRRMVAVREAPWFTKRFFGTLWAPYDCQYFVHKLAPRPVLFQFGKRDTVLSPTTFHKMLSLAGEPKDVIWYDAGHGLRGKTEQASSDVQNWLAKQWKMSQIAANPTDFAPFSDAFDYADGANLSGNGGWVKIDGSDADQLTTADDPGGSLTGVNVVTKPVMNDGNETGKNIGTIANVVGERLIFHISVNCATPADGNDGIMRLVDHQGRFTRGNIVFQAGINDGMATAETFGPTRSVQIERSIDGNTWYEFRALYDVVAGADNDVLNVDYRKTGDPEWIDLLVDVALTTELSTSVDNSFRLSGRSLSDVVYWDDASVAVVPKPSSVLRHQENPPKPR